MKPSVEKAIKEDPLSAIRVLLDSDFWLESIAADKSYLRFEDDSQEGNISVFMSKDGDGHIQVMSKPDPQDCHFSFRFRIPMIGGGQSPRTRNALLFLAEAIRLDNEKNPQTRKRSE